MRRPSSGCTRRTSEASPAAGPRRGLRVVRAAIRHTRGLLDVCRPRPAHRPGGFRTSTGHRTLFQTYSVGVLCGSDAGKIAALRAALRVIKVGFLPFTHLYPSQPGERTATNSRYARHGRELCSVHTLNGPAQKHMPCCARMTMPTGRRGNRQPKDRHSHSRPETHTMQWMPMLEIGGSPSSKCQRSKVGELGESEVSDWLS